MHCTLYQPSNLEAYTFVAQAVIREHERRIALLRTGLETLRGDETLYREAIKAGSIPLYENGRFAQISDLPKG